MKESFLVDYDWIRTIIPSCSNMFHIDSMFNIIENYKAKHKEQLNEIAPLIMQLDYQLKEQIKEISKTEEV
jgi:hypothetical protein